MQIIHILPFSDPLPHVGGGVLVLRGDLPEAGERAQQLRAGRRHLRQAAVPRPSQDRRATRQRRRRRRGGGRGQALLVAEGSVNLAVMFREFEPSSVILSDRQTVENRRAPPTRV